MTNGPKEWTDIDYIPCDHNERKRVMDDIVKILLDRAGLKIQKGCTEHEGSHGREYTLDHFRVIDKEPIEYMKSKKNE